MRQAYQVERANTLDLFNEMNIQLLFIHASVSHSFSSPKKKVIGRDTPVVSLSTKKIHFIVYGEGSASP